MNRNITALILLILGVGVYFTVTKNILAEANSIRAVNNQYSSAIANADQLVKVRDQVLKEWRSISPDDQDKLDKMIPSTVDNIRLIIDLNSVALRHGFSLKNIKATAATAPKTSSTALINNGATVATAGGGASGRGLTISNPILDTVNLSFSVTAPYNQFIAFLQDLEANLRIMDVTHLTVTANNTGTYDFGLELKTYWLRQ